MTECAPRQTRTRSSRTFKYPFFLHSFMSTHDEIQKSAKKIIDTFMDALKQVEHIDTSFLVKREQNVRKEGTDPDTDEEFRDRMLANAPNTQNECILVEKKQW